MKRKASTFGLRLPPDLLEQVNELAEKTNRTRTDVITDALRAYMGIQEPQGESGNRLDLMVSCCRTSFTPERRELFLIRSVRST